MKTGRILDGRTWKEFPRPEESNEVDVAELHMEDSPTLIPDYKPRVVGGNPYDEPPSEDELREMPSEPPGW